jgi:glycosyltransferase EpsF
MTNIHSRTPERVLHIVGRMDRAGAETMVMNLYREIDRSRFQFDFIYFTGDRCNYDDEIEALGGRIYRICTGNILQRFWSLRALLREGGWSIVHSHTLFSSALHLTAARIAGVQHRVAHSHNTQDANSESLAGRLYQRAARWLLGQVSTRRVACGVAAAEYLFPGRQDVVVIPNAVDIDRFAEASGAAVRSALGIREGQIAIVQVGRFMSVKNHVRSVAIARALRQAGVDFVLLLVGAGPEQTRIERLLHEAGLENRVRLLGLRTDIPELMAAADVMLMPSLYEGFPVVLVEAQAAGLPSVVSSVVSREVDLELSLVSFVGLDAPDQDWVKGILRAAQGFVPDVAKRRSILEASGFSSAAGATRLEKMYTTV